MSKPHSHQPSPGELELLHFLWAFKSATVKQVHEAANDTRTVKKSMNTTLKLMQVMEEKGLIQRDGNCRPQPFSAVIAETTAQRGLLKDVMARAFKGNMGKLVLCALHEDEVSQSDIDAIQTLLDAHKDGK